MFITLVVLYGKIFVFDSLVWYPCYYTHVITRIYYTLSGIYVNNIQCTALLKSATEFNICFVPYFKTVAVYVMVKLVVFTYSGITCTAQQCLYWAGHVSLALVGRNSSIHMHMKVSNFINIDATP